MERDLQPQYRAASWRGPEFESPADQGSTFVHEFQPKVMIKSLPVVRSRVEAAPVVFDGKSN
jgi:hypothetical protein